MIVVEGRYTGMNVEAEGRGHCKFEQEDSPVAGDVPFLPHVIYRVAAFTVIVRMPEYHDLVANKDSSLEYGRNSECQSVYLSHKNRVSED